MDRKGQVYKKLLCFCPPSDINHSCPAPSVGRGKQTGKLKQESSATLQYYEPTNISQLWKDHQVGEAVGAEGGGFLRLTLTFPLLSEAEQPKLKKQTKITAF